MKTYTELLFYIVFSGRDIRRQHHEPGATISSAFALGVDRDPS